MSLNLNLSDVKIFDIVTLLWLSKSICFWHSEFQFTNVQTHHVPFRRRCSTHMTVPNHFWARKQSCEKLLFIFFKVSKSVHHHSTIQINQPTRCNNFSVYYPDVYLQLNMFRAFSRPSSGAQWLRWQSLVLPSYLGDSRAVLVVGPTGRQARPRTQHDYHQDTKVTPEPATAVIELLMMGGKTTETCWAVNKRQDNKLKNSCTRFVIYLK